MHPELAPTSPVLDRRALRLEAIRRRERHIAWLQAQQRRDVAAVYAEDRDGLSERFVADELALLCHRSPRQAQHWLATSQAFAALPVVGTLIEDGTWFLDHADAVITELLGSGVTDPAEQQQVLDLVVARRPAGTPYELRQATRTAIVVLFPERAAERARKAHRDRDVVTSSDAPGSACLSAYGSTLDVAAMMASLDALCWPPAPEDTRSAAQRRFDALRDLVCGRSRPGQWSVQVLVDLATLEGRDDLPAEVVGMGVVPAPLAREAALAGALRRVVVDDEGRLVAVDSAVHRPDLAPEHVGTVPGVALEDEPEPAEEPDPDAPSAEDLAWLEDHTDRQLLHGAQDRARESARRRGGALSPYRMVGGQTRHETGPLLPSRWSAAGLERALRRLRTDPVSGVDLRTDRYAVPVRLKRYLVLRDRTCVFPGCPRRAQQCDSDHLLPWPRGATVEVNLASECEHHHQAKHDRFEVARLPDGTFRWTTPTGHSYDRPPRPVLDNLRRPVPDLHHGDGSTVCR